MPRSAGGSKRGSAVILAAVLAFASMAAAAEGANPAISGVRIFVDGRPAEAEIAGLLPLAAGQPFSQQRVDAAVKQLYRTGLFADIRVLREGEDDVRLEFRLDRRLTTRRVKFNTEPGPSVKTLRDSLYAIRPDAPYSEEKRIRAEAEIRDFLRKQGYLNCRVEASADRVGDEPSVDVVFSVVPGSRFVLRDVGFKGSLIVSAVEATRLVESRPGRPYDPSILAGDVARLREFYVKLGYPRAEVSVQGRVFHESDATVSLDFKVVPNERIRVEVSGAGVDQAPLLALWEDRVSEDWAVAQSEARILADLRGRGYVFASVRTTLDRTAGELRVVQRVDPGEKVRIGDLEFEGISQFSAAEIKAAVGIGRKIPYLSPIESGDLFDVPARIVRFYESRGFVRTTAELRFRREGRWTIVVFRVGEGVRRSIARLSVSGAVFFPASLLLAQVVSVAGGPFTSTNVQRDIGRLEAFYLNQGLRGTRVAAAVAQAGEDRFDVEFRVEEGRRVRVNKIVVAGLVVTRRSLIDRTLRLREGDWASSEAILESRRGLEKLGIFSGVRVEEVSTGPESENLVFNLREGERNLIGLGAGVETKNEPTSLDLGRNVIGPRITAEFIRSNVFGRAAQFSLVTQFSERERRAVLSWEEPSFFGIPVRTALTGWLEREALVSYGFDQRGISLSGSKDLAGGWVAMTAFRWASTTLYFLDVAESEVDRQHQPFSATSVSETVILDRRDDSFNPVRGFFLSGMLEWAVPLLQTESDYVKTFVKYQHYIPIIGRWNFSANIRLGLSMGRIPIHERFFAGGSNSFRGEYFDELGPRDAQSFKPVGGKMLAVANFEMKFPLFPSLPDLVGAVFFDIGNVFFQRSDFRFTSLENALGLGLRYRTPLGPVRFDLAWNLAPAPGAGGALAFITIGNVF